MKPVAAVGFVSESFRMLEHQHVTFLLVCVERIQPTCSSLTAGVMAPELHLAFRVTNTGMVGLSVTSDSAKERHFGGFSSLTTSHGFSYISLMITQPSGRINSETFLSWITSVWLKKTKQNLSFAYLDLNQVEVEILWYELKQAAHAEKPSNKSSSTVMYKIHYQLSQTLDWSSCC